MTDSNAPDDTKKSTTLPKSFLVFIGGSIATALLLVLISMQLYRDSGAAQLDLSRPIYESVRAQAQESERYDGFDASGELDETSLKEFEALYKEKTKKVRTTKAFSSSPLSDKSLGIVRQ